MSSDKPQLDVSAAARDLLSDRTLVKAQQTFQSLDDDGDGKIEFEEYLNHLLAEFKVQLTQKFQAIDTDKDGSLNFEEFLTATVPHYAVLKKFKRFDTDGDNLLSFEEVEQIARELDSPFDRDRLKEIFQKIDKDADGKVTFEAYLGAMSRYGFQ